MLRRLVDNALDVGHVEEALLDLHDHCVQRRLINGQFDGQDLQRHLLNALRVCSLLWSAGGRRETNRGETVLKQIEIKHKKVLKSAEVTDGLIDLSANSINTILSNETKLIHLGLYSLAIAIE